MDRTKLDRIEIPYNGELVELWLTQKQQERDDGATVYYRAAGFINGQGDEIVVEWTEADADVARAAIAKARKRPGSLPIGLAELRDRRIWVCHPLIWNPEKHSGLGGYDKPPINPYTLGNGQTDREESRATYEKAVEQIGKATRITNKNGLVDVTVAGVGVALGGTGICALDMDGVYNPDRKTITAEAAAILKTFRAYAEVSPSGNGLHVLFYGSLPDTNHKKIKGRRDYKGGTSAEYQFMDSGYITVTGDYSSQYAYLSGDRTEQAAAVYKTYFEPFLRRSETAAPAVSPSVVSSIPDNGPYNYGSWLKRIQHYTDAQLLDAIYQSPGIGERVRRLYSGDMSDAQNNHSDADQMLMSYLYSFTSDASRTMSLFMASGLYSDFDERRKSRTYLQKTLQTAQENVKPLVGHIEFTKEERREYARKKAQEERNQRAYTSRVSLDKASTAKRKKVTL